MAWPKTGPHARPARGMGTNLPASGGGLGGKPTGKPAKAFSKEHQPPVEAKLIGKEIRAEFRAKLAENLDKVATVYEDALVDEDTRVRLQAAKQISVELWGSPAQSIEHGAGDGAQPITEIRYRWGTPKADDDS